MITTGRNQTYTETTVLVTENCCSCGVMFAMPNSLQDKLIQEKSKRSFYCPNGHSQHYVGESDAAKAARLARELEREKQDSKIYRETIQLERADKLKERTKRLKTEKQIKRIKHRVENGVCLHCNRSFVDLKRHMHNKHGK